MITPAKPSDRPLRSEFAAQATLVPPARSALSGRTFSRSWDGAEYGAAVKRYRRRANWADRAGWIATTCLLAATIWVIYG